MFAAIIFWSGVKYSKFVHFKYLETLIIPHEIRKFGSYTVNDFIFQLCTCTRMCLLLNWQTCKL